MAPGVNRLGRQTGTVPKTKTPNNPGHENSLAVARTHPRSNIPNNLTAQDWQSTSGQNRNRSRKASNTRATLLEYYEESATQPDNSRFHPSENQSDLGSINRHPVEVNGLEVSSSDSRRDCVRRIPRNIMPDIPDKDNKSNISKMPDQNEIASRLTKIRDYINQTATIMDTLKSSGQPSHLAQYHKLAGMVTDLQDSEVKLSALLKSVDRATAKIEGTDSKIAENGCAENGDVDEGAATTSDSENSLIHNGVAVEKNETVENGEIKDDASEENGAVLKMGDSSRCNELRMKLEESQRKLQAMQEHQAALQLMQQRTQEQLKEARTAQSTLMAHTAAAAAAVTSGSVSCEEQSPEMLQGNLEAIRDRLYAMHEISENRSQDKLQELQSKKERMDHLVAEFQTGSNGPSVSASLPSSREKGSGESSQEGSEAGDENMSDIESDVHRVQHKMAQLAAMKAQLKRLQNLVDSGMHETGTSLAQEMTNGNRDGSPLQREENDVDEEEQAINLRRQRQGKGRRSISRTNSTSSTTAKPDNISQASIGTLQESEAAIEKKTKKLREAKLQLQHLQQLLSTVLEMRSRGEPVPERYIRMLEEETSLADLDSSVDGGNETPQRALAVADGAREGNGACVPIANCSALSVHSAHDSPEVTLEMVQAMAQELREEKEKIIRARQELGNFRDLPFREKKTNTQMLLQAKRRELEELMRKDQGQSSAVNQDICSEMSNGKSETPGFSYIGEGTSAATWGGSTQGTLDDLAERDDDVQEQSAGYSSDEAQDEEECREQYLNSQLKHTPLNTIGTGNANSASSNNKDVLAQSTSTNRDALAMSMESGVFATTQCGSVHSNAGSANGNFPPVQPPQQRPGPRNVWRKSSTDSSTTLPRAVWTPSSQNPNVVDESGVNANVTITNSNVNQNENESNASNASNTTHVNQPQNATCLQNNWWQQQAMQLQSQLEATNSLYQSLLMEHQQQQQQQQSLPCWPQPPVLAHPQLPGLRAPFQPPPPPDAFYQQLLAATQFQQQQLLLTTINQCCHLLWMQQREMATLRGAVLALQDKAHCDDYAPTITFTHQPEDTLLMSSSQTSVQPTLHQSHSNISCSNTNSTLRPGALSCHPLLKASFSGGLFQLPEELTADSSGVASAHSLPNLPGPGLLFPDPTDQHVSAIKTRSLHLQALNQYSVPQAASQAAPTGPWLPPATAGAPQGLLSTHASSTSPVPALNNQVPPGNRANNYWDNFRSYSRQNLLSSSAKSNEGISHSPSPLVDRSHNTLRNSAGLPPQPQPTTQPTYALPEQGLPFSTLNLSRKEKLNIERYRTSDNYSVPQAALPDELHYQPPLSNNQYHNSNTLSDHTPHQQQQQQQIQQHPQLQQQQQQPQQQMQQQQPQLQPRHLPGRMFSSSGANNTSSGEARGLSSWHNRPNARPYRSQRGANCKRKNPRLALPTCSAEYANQHAASSSSLASTPQDRSARKHRDALCPKSRSSLFDVLSESVYTEVAALIAVNEARPHFLIQLFRDLQMVSSDPLRQRTLQSIHELVSHYLAEASRSREGPCVPAPGPRPQQIVKSYQVKEPEANDSLVSSDEEENTKTMGGAVSLPPMEHSPPRNAAWNAGEELNLTTILPGQNEWELEAVLEDLLPFLKSHLDEVCSPTLLEAVRQQAVQLMLAQTHSHARLPLPGATQQPSGGYFQGQLDALLEDGLNKFQGCRLRDVCEDLLMVITDILQSELTFLKLVDTVRREEGQESSEEVCKNTSAPEDPPSAMHSLQMAVNSPAHLFPNVEANSQNRLESLGSAEGYNGDLAEADQSHHEDTAAGVASPQQLDGELAAAAAAEDSNDDGLLEIMQNDVARGEDQQDCSASCLTREDCEEQAKTEAEDEWAVEQDREQGLDRVPTRLTDEPDGQDRLSGPSTNHSDATSNP